MRLSHRFAALLACMALAACGGSGGGSTSASATAPVAPPAPVVTLTNFTPITVDAGPPVLATGTDPFISDNIGFVSVTICAPGGSACQTIDHVEVDTGSVGLRVVQSVIDPALLAALPTETSAQGNPVGECYGFVDGYVFGSVRQADFKVGGEAVASMPFQVIGDGGAFSTTPASCSSGGGKALNSVTAFGANGILGVGVTTTDCGALCAAGGVGASTYYDCPSSGCGAPTPRAASSSAPFEQLPNPVAAFAVDNNGTMISLPAVSSAGQASVTGTLYFGIGTQTNNGLGNATPLATTPSSSTLGAGFVTASYKGQVLSNSYIDSGTNLFLFSDSSIPQCTQANFAGYYCPASPLTISPTVQGVNGQAVSAAFQITLATSLFKPGLSVLPGVGAQAEAFDNLQPTPNSFTFGLPFFYGRNVYTALEGRSAGGFPGPYIAF